MTKLNLRPMTIANAKANRIWEQFPIWFDSSMMAPYIGTFDTAPIQGSIRAAPLRVIFDPTLPNVEQQSESRTDVARTGFDLWSGVYSEEDEFDARIARQRLDEIKADPRALISGNELAARLEKLIAR